MHRQFPWEAIFREEYSEVYLAVKEIAKHFVCEDEDAKAIMPSVSLVA